MLRQYPEDEEDLDYRPPDYDLGQDDEAAALDELDAAGESVVGVKGW